MRTTVRRVAPPQTLNGDEIKYLSPVGSKIDYTFQIQSMSCYDTTQMLFFTEGEFKALKATQEGFPCIGLGGVWGFRSEGCLLEDFRQIQFKNRQVFVILDSDGEFNFHVAKAGYSLALALAKLGAKVRVRPLPELTEEAINA
jgi:hypothetical protein